MQDIPSMVNLLEVLFAAERDFEPNAALQAAALRNLLEQPSVGHLFVAKAETSVVGMVSLLFTISTASGGRAAWLEDLVVSVPLRGHGIGSQLLRYAIGWARRHDIKRITLLTDFDNERAQRLYIQEGFAPSRMVPLRLQIE